MSICEIPPLFVELNMLNRDKDEKYDCWKEKARLASKKDTLNNRLI